MNTTAQSAPAPRKDLPYFRWWVKDAETDLFYGSLTDAELGFYHRCLNLAWTNGGLPSDPGERSKALKKTRSYADKMWKVIGKRFKPSSDPGLLINPKQEEEREWAQTKSVRNSSAVRSRYERRSNEIQQAGAPPGSVSGSGSSGGVGVSEKKTTEVSTAEVPDFLETGSVDLALIEHPTPAEIWDEVEPLYIAGGVPTSDKHRGLILGYISDIPAQKRARIPNFVKWAFVTGRWPSPAKTKGFLSLMQSGDWDVELSQRVLPSAAMSTTPSKAEAAQRAASEAFRRNEARRGNL